MNGQHALKIGTFVYKNLHNVQFKQHICTLSISYSKNNHFKCVRKRTDFLRVKNGSNFQTHEQRRGPISTFSNNDQNKQIICKDIPELLQSQKRYAGHSHWHNIQHIKGAKDKARSALISQYMARIRLAIKDGGSADPKVNGNLAKALEAAKSKSVPNETIQKVLKAGEASALAGKEEIIEGSGVGGMMIIVQTYTDKPMKARSEVQSRLKKYGASIGGSGTAMHSFERKGIVEIELDKEDSSNHDDHIEMALEAEAEDVSMTTREDGVNVLQFECDYLDVKKVKGYFEAKEKNVIFAESVFVPLNTAPMSEENVEQIGKLIDKLKEYDYVEEVYTNVVVATG